MTTVPAAALWPWPAGVATGIGSWPGADPASAVAGVLDLLPDFPHLPELPARGPWADLTGRGIAVMAGLTGELSVSGWRLVPHAGSDALRADSMLNHDLDALEERLAGFHGPVKVQIVGPITLAATVELGSGHAAVTDAGARRDLAQALAEGVSEHLAQLRRRVPGADLVLQVDEPALPICLAGELPTASGFSRVRAVAGDEAQRWLALVIASGADAWPVVHCCDPRLPVGRVVAAGARGLSLDLTRTHRSLDDPIGAALEAGVGLLAGVVPAAPDASGIRSGPVELSDPSASVDAVRRLWHRLGLAPERMSEQVVVTPCCGLAGSSPAEAAAAYRLASAGARALHEDPLLDAERGVQA